MRIRGTHAGLASWGLQHCGGERRACAGKLLVHGGFAGKAVSADAHVLEVQAGGGSHGGHKRHPSLSAESSAMRDSVANERNGASPAGQSSAVDGSSGVDNATAAESSGAAGASSPARQGASGLRDADA